MENFTIQFTLFPMSITNARDYFLRTWPQLPEEILQDLAGIFHPHSAKRKTILTAEGEVEKYLYLVLEGVQRAYAIGEDGREATLIFTYALSFSGVADSFLLQRPSRYWFETLTPSQFLRASFQDFDAVLCQHPRLERVLRLAICETLEGVLVRQIEVQSYTAEQRFRTLMQRSPHLLQLIPHKYIANYLGMDATNFSKLLGQIRI
jgi:CRP-like cAMP-binding protein